MTESTNESTNESGTVPRKFLVILQKIEDLKVVGFEAPEGFDVPVGSWNGADMVELDMTQKTSLEDRNLLDSIDAIIRYMKVNVDFNDDTLHIQEVDLDSFKKPTFGQLS